MTIRAEVERIKRELDKQESTTVRVALFGQPGAGKSSLINALVGRPVAKVGVATDTTKEAANYKWNGVVLTDLPGYDTARFPAATYVERFGIREYDLFLCVLTMRMHEADSRLFRKLHEMGKVCVFVSNKKDQLWQEGSAPEDLQKGIELDVRTHTGIVDLPLHFTSCKNSEGLAELQAAVESNLESAKRERWATTAKAYSHSALEAKREGCTSAIRWVSALSALNGLNPIPGTDIAIDIALMIKTFSKIRNAYGLTDEQIETAATLVPAIGPVANRILEWGTKEGLMLLLKQFAKKATVKQIAKYIPFVGQVIAAVAGFGINMQAGNAYLSACHDVGTAILEEELKHPGAPRGL